jgi:hypothetical protein
MAALAKSIVSTLAEKLKGRRIFHNRRTTDDAISGDPDSDSIVSGSIVANCLKNLSRNVSAGAQHDASRSFIAKI